MLRGRNVAGGGSMLSHVVGSAVWTDVAPPPVGQSFGMGNEAGLLWLAGFNNVFYFYDVGTNVWSSTLTVGPPGMLAAVNVDNKTYALAQNGTSIEVWRLETTSHIVFD